ncbi:uL13 family ribosomal protein, partial [Staphylococcus capitis]|uniref:uL13 family ribosomal protein n=1 Tax=Staphylococcus capitis TaxID=29388 RepID=UPI0016434A93
IINPSKIQFTPNKQQHKIYHPHSNHPPPLKSITPPQLTTTNPQPLLQTSIKPILPSSRLPQKQPKKLFLYPPAQHPHPPQQPENYHLPP